MNMPAANNPHQTKEMLLGSDTIAWGVKLCRPEVIAAYPITPQTHIIETLSQMVDNSEMQSQYINVESEMSALAACFGAVSTGSRAFTATSSHGLALMHEMLHWFSGSRMPLVLVNANRALGAPWNIWTDQSDTLSQRDTGWLQLYCETAQEALDSIIQAYRLTERIMLPVMVIIDGFILSHTMEQLYVPNQELVDRFLPKYKPPYSLDVDNPLSFGAAATQNNFYNLRKFMAKTMQQAKKELNLVHQDFAAVFGRSYQGIESYCLEDADTVFVCSGALAGTARVAIKKMRSQGKKIGLCKLRQFRPFPKEELLGLLSDKPKILVMNRAVSFGAGGTLSQELRAAFYSLDKRPLIYDLVVSLGGKEVYPETIMDLYTNIDSFSTQESNWFED